MAKNFGSGVVGGVVLIDPATGQPYKATGEGATDEMMAALVDDPDSATRLALSSTFAAPVMGSAATSGYARTIPIPTGVTNGIRMLARDPLVPGRLWGQNRSGDRQVGYTDDHGATFTKRFTPPAGTGAGIPALRFWNGYAWLVQVPTSGAKRGQLWRSPYPASDGTGWSWTLVFDLAAPPAGIVTGANSTLRAESTFGSGADVFLAEYSPAIVGASSGNAVVGGPNLYYSPDSGQTWFHQWRFQNARHIHSGQIINGAPWVSVGDAGSSWTDRGLWSAPTIGASGYWTKRSVGAEGNLGSEGNDLYPINIIGMEVAGAPMIVGESDHLGGAGPLCFQGQNVNRIRPLQELCRPPFPYVLGTMRHITVTPEGNLMWLHTGEAGAVGDLDTIMVAKGPHFSTALPLESVPASPNQFESPGYSVLDGDYVWFGHHRIRRPAFPDQVITSPPAVPTPGIVANPTVGIDFEWVASSLAGADGAVVSSWAPSVGPLSLAQGDPAARPTVQTSGGRKVVRFDGVDDFLQATGVFLGQTMTMMMAVTVRAYNTASGLGLFTPDGPGFSSFVTKNGSPFVGQIVGGSNGAVPVGTRVVVTFIACGSASSVWVDGEQVGAGDMGTAIARMNHVRIGYLYESAVARYSQIDVDRVRIYRRALTGAELSAAIAAMT